MSLPLYCRHVQAKTAEAMRGLASLTAATVRCMVGLQLGEDGLPAGLTGLLDDHNAADTGGCWRRVLAVGAAQRKCTG